MVLAWAVELGTTRSIAPVLTTPMSRESAEALLKAQCLSVHFKFREHPVSFDTTGRRGHKSTTHERTIYVFRLSMSRLRYARIDQALNLVLPVALVSQNIRVR